MASSYAFETKRVEQNAGSLAWAAIGLVHLRSMPEPWPRE
jgi:hypothetical protein